MMQKHKELLYCVRVNVSAPHILECVCLPMHDPTAKTLTYMGDNLYVRSLHFSYLWRGEEEEGCGVMCFARLPAASGRELYTKQPPI